MTQRLIWDLIFFRCVILYYESRWYSVIDMLFLNMLCFLITLNVSNSPNPVLVQHERSPNVNVVLCWHLTLWQRFDRRRQSGWRCLRSSRRRRLFGRCGHLGRRCGRWCFGRRCTSLAALSRFCCRFWRRFGSCRSILITHSPWIIVRHDCWRLVALAKCAVRWGGCDVAFVLFGIFFWLDKIIICHMSICDGAVGTLCNNATMPKWSLKCWRLS